MDPPPPPPPFLKEGKVHFNYLPQRGEGDSEKLKKGDGSMVQGQVFLKEGRWAGTFRINFFQGLSFLHLEITLHFAKLCYAFDEKKKFSATIIL